MQRSRRAGFRSDCSSEGPFLQLSEASRRHCESPSSTIHVTNTVISSRSFVTPLRSYAVPGFSRHTLTIEMVGYTVYRTSVSVDEEEQTVAVPLNKAP